jgi:cytochrome c5
MLPPVVRVLTDAERANGLAVARTDRQAVFKADCASCHAKPAQGKYGKPLYDAVCGICHDAEHRAEAAVPDLHNLKVPTSNEFWRTWIAHGKAGSLMPAFSAAEGGPLTDMRHRFRGRRRSLGRRQNDAWQAPAHQTSACGKNPARYLVNHDSETG